MPNFNWQEKTGLSESQWLQIIVAVLMGLAHHFKISVEAQYVGYFVQASLGLFGVHQRNKQKAVDNARIK